MAATATILSPRTGDIVGLTVPFAVAYAGFAGETLNTEMGAASDPSPPTLSGDDLHMCSVTTTIGSDPELQPARARANSSLLHEQLNVKVTAGDTPTPIDEPVIEESAVKGDKKIKKASGMVPVGSTAAYVVCQVIEVDAVAGTATPVGAGADTVAANRKWQVDFDPHIPVKPAKTIQYAIRAFVYDKAMTLLGSETKPVKKT